MPGHGLGGELPVCEKPQLPGSQWWLVRCGVRSSQQVDTWCRIWVSEQVWVEKRRERGGDVLELDQRWWWWWWRRGGGGGRLTIPWCWTLSLLAGFWFEWVNSLSLYSSTGVRRRQRGDEDREKNKTHQHGSYARPRTRPRKTRHANEDLEAEGQRLDPQKWGVFIF